jgi:hypothetical protein
MRTAPQYRIRSDFDHSGLINASNLSLSGCQLAEKLIGEDRTTIAFNGM